MTVLFFVGAHKMKRRSSNIWWRFLL